MIRCNLCGRVFDSGNALKDQQGAHMHLLKMHYDDYRAVRFSRAALTKSSGAVYRGKDQGKKDQGKREVRRPAGFRPLNERIPEEAAAYKEGFRYIDDDENVYDRNEAREKGWI